MAPQPARDASGQIITVPVTLPEGTEFTAQTTEFLSSQTAQEGDPVNLEVENNVVSNGAFSRIKEQAIIAPFRVSLVSPFFAGSARFARSIILRRISWSVFATVR